MVRELEKLKAEVTKAAEAQVIEAEVATDVEYRHTKAVQQAQTARPEARPRQANPCDAPMDSLTCASIAQLRFHV